MATHSSQIFQNAYASHHGRSQDFLGGGEHFSKIFKKCPKKIAKNLLFQHIFQKILQPMR